MELEIYDIAGKKTGKKAKLNDAVFGIEPNEHAMYLDVKHHLASGLTAFARWLSKKGVPHEL